LQVCTHRKGADQRNLAGDDDKCVTTVLVNIEEKDLVRDITEGRYAKGGMISAHAENFRLQTIIPQHPQIGSDHLFFHGCSQDPGFIGGCVRLKFRKIGDQVLHRKREARFEFEGQNLPDFFRPAKGNRQASKRCHPDRECGHTDGSNDIHTINNLFECSVDAGQVSGCHGLRKGNFRVGFDAVPFEAAYHQHSGYCIIPYVESEDFYAHIFLSLYRVNRADTQVCPYS